jgi:hypothetical protein
MISDLFSFRSESSGHFLVPLTEFVRSDIEQEHNPTERSIYPLQKSVLKDIISRVEYISPVVTGVCMGGLNWRQSFMLLLSYNGGAEWSRLWIRDGD